MRPRILSLALAGLAILALAGSAFAQVATTSIRPDVIVGISQTEGIPPVASGTFVPQVIATDPTSASLGTSIVPYVDDLDTYFARTFGWRSSKPVTVELFSTGDDLITALQGLRGTTLTDTDRAQVLGEPAFLEFVSQGSGAIPSDSWVILVNMDVNAANQLYQALSGQFASINPSGSLIPSAFNPEVISTAAATSPDVLLANGMTMIEESMAHQYANLMVMDLGGTNVPMWFQQGLANEIAFSIVPGTPMDSGTAYAVANFQAANNFLPTVSDVAQNFASLVGQGGQTAAVAQGISFLSSRSLFDTLGGTGIATFLTGLGGGVDFSTELQSTAGFNLDQLNTNYQSLIPMP